MTKTTHHTVTVNGKPHRRSDWVREDGSEAHLYSVKTARGHWQPLAYNARIVRAKIDTEIAAGRAV